MGRMSKYINQNQAQPNKAEIPNKINSYLQVNSFTFLCSPNLSKKEFKNDIGFSNLRHLGLVLPLYWETVDPRLRDSLEKFPSSYLMNCSTCDRSYP